MREAVEAGKRKREKTSVPLADGGGVEYACRESLSSYKKYHFGDTLASDDANFRDSKLARTCTVGSYKKPNKFGLHDMHGNVWEWCSDWYDETYYANSPEDNPPGGTGSSRVLRGGSWNNEPVYCRAAYRFRYAPAARYSFYGFRVCFAWTN